MFLKKYLYIFLFISFCTASDEEENPKDRKRRENRQKAIESIKEAGYAFIFLLQIAWRVFKIHIFDEDSPFPELHNPNEPNTSTLLSSSNANHERRFLLLPQDADKIHQKTITDETISTNKYADKGEKLAESNTNPQITDKSTSSSTSSSETNHERRFLLLPQDADKIHQKTITDETIHTNKYANKGEKLAESNTNPQITDESTSSSTSSSETDESTSSSTSSSETNKGPCYSKSYSETNESTSSSTSSSETNETPRVYNFFEDIDEIGDIILARIERDKQREAAKGQENSEELLKNIPAEEELHMRGECSIQ